MLINEALDPTRVADAHELSVITHVAASIPYLERA